MDENLKKGYAFLGTLGAFFVIALMLISCGGAEIWPFLVVLVVVLVMFCLWLKD